MGSRASGWLPDLAAVSLSSSPGGTARRIGQGSKGEAFVTRQRYEHPLAGREPGPRAERTQSPPEEATNSGERRARQNRHPPSKPARAERLRGHGPPGQGKRSAQGDRRAQRRRRASVRDGSPKG